VIEKGFGKVQHLTVPGSPSYYAAEHISPALVGGENTIVD
jgi:hypothetical protein